MPHPRVKKEGGYDYWTLVLYMSTIQGESVFDDGLDAIANPKRRRLLIALLEHNPIDEEDDVPVVIVDTDADAEIVELLVEMRHTHLPKLEEYGFIRWNRDSHEVVKGPRFDEIRPLLQLLADHEDELPSGWL
jgi:hypothetical protein